jgi:hypothetical protein
LTALSIRLIFGLTCGLSLAESGGLRLIRMLIDGYCFGIRSELRLGEEVHPNLANSWF